MAKAVKQDLSSFIKQAKETKTNTPIQKVVPANPVKEEPKIKSVNFPFNLEQNRIEFLRDYVLFKRKSSPEFFTFSNTDAVREGIEYLREKYKDLEQRPASLKYSTRVGTNGLLNGVIKKQTTFSISVSDREFIYDLVFAKDGNPTEYNKADLFDELLKELSERHPEVEKTF